MFQSILKFAEDHWRDGIEILILAIIVYYSYRYFRATRGARILSGLLLIFIALILLSEILQLAVIAWLVKSIFAFLALALVVIFQPELRRALAELGSHRFFSQTKHNREMLDQLHQAIVALSKKRFGALIAIERGITLKPYLETGVGLDCLFSSEALLSVFYPKGALHDGGVILRTDRIAGAGCVFPVSQRELLDRSIGLRHRAGIGITEETDAISVVVSEETGNLSLCHNGKLERDLSEDAFKTRLHELFFLKPKENEGTPSEQLEAESRQSPGGDRHLVSRQGTRRAGGQGAK